MSNPNTVVFPGTIIFYTAQIKGWSWGESLAVLNKLGRYNLDTVWYAPKGSWVACKAQTLDIPNGCPIRKLNFQIQFTGGPGFASSQMRGYKYFNGCLRTFVLDRILRTCRRSGKAQTLRQVFQTIAEARKTKEIESGC